MKQIVIAISLAITFTANAAFAEAMPTVDSCMAGKSWMFFTHELEAIAQEKKTSVLIMNVRDQVVGVISVTPDRAEAPPHLTTNVQVEKISLCGDIQVADFYYADDAAANLLEWTAAKTGAVTVTQDEGMIVINAKVSKVEKYATRIEVEFKTYDVMTEVENFTAKDRKTPGFLEEWGVPKGAGKFHFYIPANWKLIP